MDVRMQTRETILRFTLVVCGVLAVLALLAGCDQPNSPAERQEQREGVEQAQKEPQEEAPPDDLPSYEATLDQDCTQGNIPGRCLGVATPATSEEDFRALTAHFRDENPEAMAIIISFYPPGQIADISGAGVWFANEEAARAFLRKGYTDLDIQATDIQAIMDDGGMLVISMEDMTREMCAEWDVSTMGTPPKEWNCPGY